MGGNNRQQMGPLYRKKRIQDTIHQNSSFVICSNQKESILLPVSQRRDQKPSQQRGSGKGTEFGNSRLLFPDIPCAKKERKVSFNNRPVFINSKSLFDCRIKEIAKSNFEAQQQRFLASTSIQSQSHSFKPPSQSRAFKIPKYPAKQTTSRPKPTQSYRSKNIPQSSSSHTKKDNIKRTGNVRQFPSSKPASSSARL